MLVRNSRREFLAAAAADRSWPTPARTALRWGPRALPAGAKAFTCSLSERALFPNAANPSCLALNASGTRLYSANETSTYQGVPSGSVSAYEIERPGGRLKLMNTVASEGAGPCHLSLHQSGKWVFVANYHAELRPCFRSGRTASSARPAM